MASVKIMNVLEGTGNRVLMPDLAFAVNQSVYMGSAYNVPVGVSAFIIGGFTQVAGDTYNGGYIWFNGNVYGSDSPTFTIGQYMYANQTPSSQRIAQDNTPYYAYTEYTYSFSPTKISGRDNDLIISTPLTQEIINTLKNIIYPAFSNSNLADMNANTIKGRISTVGPPQDLVQDQAWTIVAPTGLSNGHLLGNTGSGKAIALTQAQSWSFVAPAGVNGGHVLGNTTNGKAVQMTPTTTWSLIAPTGLSNGHLLGNTGSGKAIALTQAQ